MHVVQCMHAVILISWDLLDTLFCKLFIAIDKRDSLSSDYYSTSNLHYATSTYNNNIGLENEKKFFLKKE